jgi:hypothetical protein
LVAENTSRLDRSTGESPRAVRLARDPLSSRGLLHALIDAGGSRAAIGVLAPPIIASVINEAGPTR